MRTTRLKLAALFITLSALLAGATLDCAPRENPLPLALGAIPRVAGALELSLERALVFKDGYGLFVKTASGVTDERGEVFTGEVPDAAVLGSFWATADGREIHAMRAGWVETVEEVSEEGPCATTLELLRANPGKSVTLSLEKEQLSGTIMKLGSPARPHARPHAVSSSEQGAQLIERDLTDPGTLLFLEGTPRGRVVLPASQVLSVSGKDLSMTCKRTREVTARRKRLTFDLGKAAAGKAVKLHLLYFSSGIRWIPTYRVRTGSEKTAELSLQGELLNEEEDLRDTPVDLVVGVPNFRFKGVISPLSLEQTMRQALSQAAPNLMSRFDNNVVSNAMFTQRASEFSGRSSAAEAGAPGVMNIAPDLAAEGHQDLFVYSLKSLTLEKGARATAPLWTAKVPQRHLYTLDLALQRGMGGGEGFVVDGAGSPQQLTRNLIFHQLELSNPGAMPWTTGAAMAMEGNLPLGQELLGYTPAGAKTLLPLTNAIDLRHELHETELERTPNAITVNQHGFTLVRKRGTLRLTSFRKESSTMQVKLSTGGKVESVSDGGEVVGRDLTGNEGVAYPNGRGEVTWELRLDAGATRTLTYVVSYYQ